jgi:fructose-bisphosphate aldolase class 1
LETISDGLRIIYNLIDKGNLDNALWEITELEQYLKKKSPGLIEKYNLKTYFMKWRKRLVSTNKHGIRLVLDDLELLAKKLDNVIID